MAKYTGAESIDYIINKFKSNSSLRVNLKHKLQEVTSQLYLNAQSADTFCYRFQIPQRLPDQLFTIYGVPYNKIKEDFKKLKFHTNRMFEDPYYQSLISLYLIGLYTGDDELRKIALFLILVKLYNGMQYKYFRFGCKENVAEYIKRVRLNNKSLFKNKSPLEVIAYFIETLDTKYMNEIKKDPENMVLRLFVQTWSRINQVFRNISVIYYQHVNDKDIDASIEALQKDDEGALKLEDHLLQGVIDVLIDKFDKAISFKFPDLPITEKQLLMNRLTVTENAVNKIYEYIKNYQDIVKHQLSQFLMAVGIKTENDIHKLPILHTVDKILMRKNEIHSNSLKNLIDESLNEIYGSAIMSSVSVTQKLKLRKLYMYILFYVFQRIMSKMTKFERTLV
ncbi:MAG TPA: hypothetical protein EYG89_01885 [Bacteroidia bacterium]|nr:hypothetical protein [Bacteroidia bacterium]